MLRILIVNERQIARRGLQTLLEERANLEIVGTAKDAYQAIRQVEILQPDIVLIDIEMPGTNGLTTTQRICQQFPQTQVIVISSYESGRYAVQAIQAGAKAYLLKSTEAENLERAIWSVHRGYFQLEAKLLPKAILEDTASYSITPKQNLVVQTDENKPAQKLCDFNQIADLAGLFFKLGSTGFGGLAVQIAMMDYEVVVKRKWFKRETFLNIVGASNLVPGPNAVEIALQIGYIRAGWLGFMVSGICFIVPSVLFTIGFAWSYQLYGTLPQVAPFLEGTKPAILAVILISTWKLGKAIIKNWRSAVIGMIALAALFLGINEITALFACGIIGMFWLRIFQKSQNNYMGEISLPRDITFSILKTVSLLVLILISISLVDTSNFGAVSGWKLGFFFLKVGFSLYGGGYVLIAFLQGGLVHDFGWLTQQQLLDAVAVGQITPGPLLSTAAFVGYLILGISGAIIATIAVFLPSFIFSIILHSVIPKLRKFIWTSAFLDAITISSIALMAFVVLTLSQSILIDWKLWLITCSIGAIGIRWKVNPSFSIVGGAIYGWIL